MTPLVIPELDVSNLDRSLSFYRTILGFQTHVERPEERFAYLIRGRVHLMLQEAQGPGRRFRTAPLKYPFGRGINLQIEVPDVNHLHSEAVEAGARSDEHTSELQSLMRISYAVFCLKKKKHKRNE